MDLNEFGAHELDSNSNANADGSATRNEQSAALVIADNSSSSLGNAEDFDDANWHPENDAATVHVETLEGVPFPDGYDVYELIFDDAIHYALWSRDGENIVSEVGESSLGLGDWVAIEDTASSLGAIEDFDPSTWVPANDAVPVLSSTLDGLSIPDDQDVYLLEFTDGNGYGLWSHGTGGLLGEVKETSPGSGEWELQFDETETEGSGTDVSGTDPNAGDDDFREPIQIADDAGSRFYGRMILSDKFAVTTEVDTTNGNVTQSADNAYILDMQILGTDMAIIESYDPTWTVNIKLAKGLLHIDNSNQGSLALDAAAVAGVGYTTGSAKMLMIWGSDTDTIKLIGSADAWIKLSLPDEEYNTMVEDYKDPGESFDVYESQVDGQTVAVILQRTMQVNLGQNANADIDLAGQFFAYNGITAEQAEQMGISSTEEYVHTDKVNGDADIILTADEGAQKGQHVQGGDLANTVTGSDKSDTIRGEGGADTLNAGAGADYIWGGTGNDIIDGGTGGDFGDFWEDADHIYFEGNRNDYIITQTNTGFTIEDTASGRDGTDTITNIEIAHFADAEVLLAAETNTTTYTDGATQQQVTEDYTRGTDFNDTIEGSAGRSHIEGGAGDDVIIGDVPGSTGNADRMIGGKGNDFMDGALRGDSAFEWESDNTAEYKSASSNYSVEKYTYSGDEVATLDTTLTTMGMSDRVTLIAGQEYLVVTDARTVADVTKGTGIDLLVNVETIQFADMTFNNLSIDELSNTTTEQVANFSVGDVTYSSGTSVLEGAASRTGSYTITATDIPEATTLNVSVTGYGLDVTSNALLAFTYDNANSVTQTVTFIAEDDDSEETSPHTGTLTHTVVGSDGNLLSQYIGEVAGASASITDNDDQTEPTALDAQIITSSTQGITGLDVELWKIDGVTEIKLATLAATNGAVSIDSVVTFDMIRLSEPDAYSKEAINIFDVLSTVGHIVENSILTGQALAAADVTNDGNVNVFDVLALVDDIVNDDINIDTYDLIDSNGVRVTQLSNLSSGTAPQYQLIMNGDVAVSLDDSFSDTYLGTLDIA
jgi:hypothetical protein